MKILLLTLLILHGIIHLLGFIKGFNLFELKEFTQPVSKTGGMLWLIAFSLFLCSAILLRFHESYWWIAVVLAVILSQGLVFSAWQSAKFGTIANLLIVLATWLVYSGQSFVRAKIHAMDELVAVASNHDIRVPSKETLASLPIPVQRWLNKSGILDRKIPISHVFMNQAYQIKLKREQKDWYPAKAHQLSTISPPAFLWSVEMDMIPLVKVYGKDTFSAGGASMLFSIGGIRDVVNEKSGSKLNEAALQRYLGELVWYPSAAFSPWISWEALDDWRAKARMVYGNMEGEGIFTFNDLGNVVRFETLRFKDTAEGAERIPWIITVLENKTFQGITIPSKCTATWMMETGPWQWAELEVLSYRALP